MIIDEIAGRLGEERFAGLAVDYADVRWHDAHKKISRLVTRSGVEIGLRLSDEASRRGLRHGDVLAADDKSLVAVEIVPCRCIAVDAGEREQLVKLCYEAGNRHAPFFYGEDGGFLLPYDAPTFAAFEKLGLAPVETTARLMAENRVLDARVTHAH
jgi:urease accessory protein